MINGEVTLLSREKIVGWAHDTESTQPAQVTIQLDGRPIKTIRANRPREGAPDGRKDAFRIRIGRSLMAYLHDQKALTFQVEGTALPVIETNLGLWKQAHRRPVGELFDKLSQGWFVTKKGEVRLSIHLDTAWQHNVLAAYNRVRRLFLEQFGYDLYITAGTLLGYVRENGFIKNDDDFDSAYLSRHTKVEDVKRELMSIIAALRQQGFSTRIGRRRNWFHLKLAPDVGFDVFPSWIEGDNYFHSFAIGGAYARLFDDGFVEATFRDQPVLVPRRAEEFLSQAYGPDWRTPDPLFQWVVPGFVSRVMHELALTPEEMLALQPPQPVAPPPGTCPWSQFMTELAAARVPRPNRWTAAKSVACQWIIDRVPPGRGVDVGGTTHLVTSLAREERDIVYYDLEPAPAEAGIDRFVVDDMANFESHFENRSLDFITTRHCLEYAPNPLYQLWLYNRALVDGGRLIVVVPQHLPRWLKHPGRFSCLPRENWRVLFGSAGFRIVEDEIGSWKPADPAFMEYRFVLEVEHRGIRIQRDSTTRTRGSDDPI